MFISGSYVSEAVRTQAELFLTAMLWGAAVGLAYDVLRILRRLIGTPKWLYICEDILFWIVEALMIYRLMFRFDSGAIRSYTMLGMITGIALYLWIFGKWLAPGVSRILLAVFGFIWKCIKKIFSIFKILFMPFLRFFRFFGGFLRKRLRFCGKFKNSFIKLLKRGRKKGRIESTNNSE